MLRLPGTTNHKPQYCAPKVRLLRADLKPQSLPVTSATASISRVAQAISVNPTGHEWRDVLEKYRKAIGPEIAQLIRAKRALRPDRSKRVFQIAAALVAVGASDDEVAAVLWVNPYFTEKWGQNLQILEDEIARIRGRAEASHE